MSLTATVLRVRPHREHDKLYTVYTKERGKLTVLGIGTAKITSKLAGHLGYFFVSEVRTVPARVWEKLTGAEIIENFSSLHQASATLGMGFYILELVDVLTKENHPDPALWDLLIAALRSLHVGDDPKDVRSRFEHEVVVALGEQPPLLEHINRELKSLRWLAEPL